MPDRQMTRRGRRGTPPDPTALVGPDRSELLLYATEDGQARIEIRLYEGTVWLTQKQIAELYQVTPQAISQHVLNIYDEQELRPEATSKQFLIVRTEGNRSVSRPVDHYSLPMVLAVGYRVRSQRGTQFRQWATTHLEEYLVKGFILDDQRLSRPAGPGSPDYFDELLERIRRIRASERRFYQKITDVYATAIDYRKDADVTQAFYATVQNKLHWAIHGHTAAEIIRERADASRPHMGLTTWTSAPSGPIRKADVTIAYREYSADGAVVFARETVHVADAHRRIALVETRTVGDEPGVPLQRIRYQLGNYLGSIALSLDDAARVVSYEEYYPHGGTAYQAVRSAIEVNWKRYRYLNMERDAETGFGYHGARYYAPWLGRWISPDPHGVGNDGTNLYAYGRNNPVSLSDPNGFDAQKGQFQWASSKEENDKRYTRLTGTVRRFLIDHGIRRDDIRDYLNKYGDRDILEHYGYVENDSGGDANREDNQNRIIEAINKYEDDYHGHTGAPGASPVTPAQARAMQAAQAQVQFYQLWLEGWQYVSNSATSAVSAGVASWFTSDQRKITGAAGTGYAASGVTNAVAQVAIGRFAAGGNRPSGNRQDPRGGGGGGSPSPEDNQPIAVGLSGSSEHKRNLVARFADKVGATTYWDLYPGPLPSESVIVERMVNEFQTRPIAVNLSGFTQVQELGPEAGLAAILAEPHKMVTEAEVSHVIASPDFFSRATFYLNGKTVDGLDRATIIRLSRGAN